MSDQENVPTTTLPLLVQEEARLYETGAERLGGPFLMAQESTLLLSTFIASISADRDVFLRCMALVKKHHTLAFLSVVRRHHVQAFMNLRQVVEGISNAAFALAHPTASYLDPDTGLIMDSKTASGRSYSWVQKEFPLHSADLKGVKEDLNKQGTHFNVLHSGRLVSTDFEAGQRNTEFFDDEDVYLSHVDLWLVTQTAVAGMHLLEQVRERFGGYAPSPDLNHRANTLYADAQNLRKTMMATQRHQKASAAAAETSARKEAAKEARRQSGGKIPAVE